MIKEINISLKPGELADANAIERAIAKNLRLSGPGKINDWHITRRSIDARKNPVRINAGVSVAFGSDKEVKPEAVAVKFRITDSASQTVVIVGAGPAGYFAALRALEAGWRPVVLERGKDVDARRLDITRLNREKQVDPESNYCFGEGGAGAFSDGKLFTRSKKRGNVKDVLQLLVHHGADPSILIDAHPHIGSDRLPKIMKAIRQTILDCGGEVHFNTKVTGLVFEEPGFGKYGIETSSSEKGKPENGTETSGDNAVRIVTGVMTSDGREINGPVILATGHSARDVYRFLNDQGVALQAKGLAMGVRLEHPQKEIDRIQYHSKEGRGEWLPAAEYSFVSRQQDRGVYSFCMCPGGVVVPAATSPGQNVVNGMSASARSSIWANSGMVVELHPGDIPGYSQHGVFEMMALQEDLEKRFYEAAGNSIAAPAQRMADFTEGKKSSTLPPSSYIPGLVSSRMDLLLPEFIAERLKGGFREFGRKAKGFLTNDAVLIGLESRTSSPVRIPRDKENMQHVDLPGLYPVGEGAGYAGGIVSAAIDGRNAFDALRSTREGIES